MHIDEPEAEYYSEVEPEHNKNQTYEENQL
jgi:hypothetical protein